MCIRDRFNYHVLEQLQSSRHAELAGIAAKGFKEARYHVRHSSEWVLRFGDGTEESHTRAQNALNELWRFTGEMFEADEVDHAMLTDGIGAVSYTHLRAHETGRNLVCRLLLEKK